MARPDERLRGALQPPPADWEVTPLPVAAVVAALVELDGRDHLLLCLRPANLRQHAGQIGFPGGKREGEESPTGTAAREVFEEIGVPASAITWLGALAPRCSSSGILVHCLVARVQPVPLRPAAAEVDRVILAPLDELLDPSRWTEWSPPVGATTQAVRPGPSFLLGPDRLWGLTARFVRDLLARLQADPG